MSETHTPGPWRISAIVDREEDGPVYHLDSSDPVNGGPVGYFESLNDNIGYGNRAGLADAHLIAAAPDLLEALRELTTAAVEHDDPRLEWVTAQVYREDIARARTAISKATSPNPTTTQGAP